MKRKYIQPTCKESLVLGGLVFEARKKNKLTSRELAKNLGIHPVALTRIENGYANPGLHTVMKIIDTLKIDITRLKDQRLINVRQEYQKKREELDRQIVFHRTKLRELRASRIAL